MKLFGTWLSGLIAPVAFLAAPAFGAIPAHPGMLNYVEGQASINGQRVTNSNVGTADVGVGQVIETGKGKAEVLLTPGVFLRLGDNTAVRLDADGLTDTRVELLNGHAMIEADNLHKQNNISISDQGAVARLEKDGIYSFSASPFQIATFDGKAKVSQADQSVDLGKGHETNTQGFLHAQKFDRKAQENADPLYQWSKVRSQYLAEANMEQARTLVVNGAGWYGSGWYWNPWFSMYSWIPGDGIFYNPFGWGFYSPYYAWAAPVVYYRGYSGYRGYPAGARYPNGYTAPATRPAPTIRGFSGGSFAHSSGGFSGGFHGGGFHGGGRR